jgi:hypothetical protein
MLGENNLSQLFFQSGLHYLLSQKLPGQLSTKFWKVYSKLRAYKWMNLVKVKQTNERNKISIHIVRFNLILRYELNPHIQFNNFQKQN